MQYPCWYQWGTEIYVKDFSVHTSSVNSFMTSLPALMSLGAKGKNSACKQPDLPPCESVYPVLEVRLKHQECMISLIVQYLCCPCRICFVRFPKDLSSFVV